MKHFKILKDMVILWLHGYTLWLYMVIWVVSKIFNKWYGLVTDQSEWKQLKQVGQVSNYTHFTDEDIETSKL